MKGHCKNCNSENIVWHGSQVLDDSIGYEYICQDCGHEGIEWYNLTYDESE